MVFYISRRPLLTTHTASRCQRCIQPLYHPPTQTVPVSKAGFLENFAKLQPIDIGWSVTFLQYIFSPDAL